MIQKLIQCRSIADEILSGAYDLDGKVEYESIYNAHLVLNAIDAFLNDLDKEQNSNDNDSDM